jgi:Macrocin-O-methyltransferase (TylF)
MAFRQSVKRLIERTGYTVGRVRTRPEQAVYDQDGLWTVHNHEFMNDPRFARAYARGVQANGSDMRWHWRVHVGLWAASQAARLEGDFVECGVNRGALSSAIMSYLDWDTRGRTFYLLDTFSGLDAALLTEREIARGALEANAQHLTGGIYVSGVESVRKNFAEWQNVAIIQGTIPGTLDQIKSERVAYLHLDLNCTRPEVAALEYLWPRLVKGGLVLLDDYAFEGYRESKLGMDAFAAEHGIEIASLPTGQGLILKPPS